MAESKKEYKARVLEAKEIVQQMFINGQKNKFSLTKIEKDVQKYLDSQGLTKFDLRTNGDRKNQAMFQAFTNSANKEIMEILQVIIPELASSLDLKQFMLFGEEALDRNEEVKKEWEDNIEDFFTMNLIPGQKPLVDLGFTPEKLGERVADQMGESLVEFLPFMIAPNLIASSGPVQGFAQSVTMDPTKMAKVMDVLKNSYYSIINSYIKNPGKSFQADIAAAIGWGAGQQMGTEISEAADEEGTMGYYDAIKGQPLETMLGFTGATTGVVAAPAVTAAFGHPVRTMSALMGGAFKNYGGIKPIVDKFQNWYKAKNKKTVQTFVDGVVNAHKDEVAAAGQIAERVAGTRTTAFEASGQQGPIQPRIISRPKLDADGNQILDKDGKPIIEKIETQPEIKLTLAEETLSPGAATEQVQIESTMVGQELDKIVKRRINNLKILDQSLETIVPSTDENFQYILDLRQGTIKPLIESLEAKIGKKSDEIAGELSTIQADLSKQESGLGLRQIIENLQISESKESLDIINNIPAGNVVFSGDTAGSAPKILEDLLSIIGLRTFEKGTEPAILKKIKSLIERYKLQDVENIRDYELPRGSDGSPLIPEPRWQQMSVAEKQKWFEDNLLNPNLTATADEAKIVTINQEAPVTFTNKDLYDIYLSADVELMSLIGKPGLDVTKQIMKLKLMKEKILSELKTNLKNEEGGTEFINSVNKYIDKFEKGVIVRVRENKVAGYTKKDEAVADAFFNAENVQAIDDFINAFGVGGNVNQDALYNMQQAILDRLANFVIDKKTGILNQDNYRRWLAQYGSVLERLAGMDKETGMPEFIASLRETPTAIGALSERLATLETRKTFLQGEKLKTSLKTFGMNSKQLNLGSVDEYVNAALSDPKVMSNITDRIIKDGAEEVWVKSILENLTSIRTGEEGFGKGFISPKEIRDMQNWLNTNSKSLETLFEKVGYKNHLENIKAIVSGFERANFVPPSKGAPALTPEQQTKSILGVNIPTLWSRIFAVQSGRVGVKYTGMEVFNRLINTVGLNHFNKLMKKAIYDPEFAKAMSKAVEGGKFTINEQKQIYGFLAKLNGTIGIASEDGAEGSSVQTEADTKVIQNKKQNYEDLPDPPNIDEFQQTSSPIVQESRLSSDIMNPVGMRGMPRPNAARNTASVSPNTYLKGQQLFNKPGEITFASQGGIMNARKPIQRVA
jgi:hypothetical protein